MDAIEAIHARQGVLRFRPDPVPPDQIDAVLAAATAAPSPVNLQPWAFVVVADPALTCRVARYLVHTQEQRVFDEFLAMPAAYTERLMGLYEGFDQTPCFILVCLDPKVRFAEPQHETVLREWYLVSLGAAMQNLMIAATALGLGTRWFGGFALDAGGGTLKAVLGIPPEVALVAATPLGYHDEPAKPRPPQEPGALADFRRGDSHSLGRLLLGKLPVKYVVHHDRW